MKNRLITGLFSAAVMVLASCSSELDPTIPSGSGILSLGNLDIDATIVSARGSRAEAGEVTKEQLTLRLSSANKALSTKEWSYGEFGDQQTVAAGDYLFEAYYGDADAEGFGEAYFYGSQEVKVAENIAAQVSLTATMGKAMVSIEYTDNFKNYLTEYSAEVLSAKGNTTNFTADETRAAYVAPGTTKVFVSFKAPNATEALRLQPAEFEAKAAHHYTVTLDVNEGAMGTPVLSVKFDDLVDTEDVDIELSNDLINTPKPVVTAEGFTFGEPVHVVEGVPFDGTLRMNIIARGGLAKADLATADAAALINRGWPSAIDLIAASSAQQTLLSDMGLKVLGLYRNPAEMAYVDFSKAVAGLAYTDGVTPAVFSLVVTDKNTKTSDATPVLKVIVDKFELELLNGYILTGEDNLQATLAYNGGNLRQDGTLEGVKVKLKNDRGTYTDCAYTASVSQSAPARSSALVNYLLNITVPAGLDKYELAVFYGDSKESTSELDVVPAERTATLSYNDVDVWSQTATVNVSASASSGLTAAQCVEAATVQVSTDGNTYSIWSNVEKTGNSLVLKGLAAGTKYWVSAYFNGLPSDVTLPVILTTEAKTQLPNSGMETWSGGATQYKAYYPGASETDCVWGTNNPLTTGNTVSSTIDAAYQRINGTLPDDGGHTGKAALVRSVGWGGGNTAAGSISIFKRADAGLLHLGSSRTERPNSTNDPGVITTDDLDCGLALASRPTSLTFWYKYSPKNGNDQGRAEAYIYDAAGNIIASSTLDLASAGSYTQATLPLNYTSNVKAAKIYVKFLSTNSTSFLSANKNNFSYPGVGSGSFIGSSLYIDDINLNYTK